MNLIIRKCFSFDSSVQFNISRVCSALITAFEIKKYQILLRLLISKRNNSLLFSDVGKQLNSKGELSRVNWLGHDSCKAFCVALLPQYSLNRSKTGLTLTSFDKYMIGKHKQITIRRGTNRPLNICRQWLSSLVMLILPNPSNPTTLIPSLVRKQVNKEHSQYYVPGNEINDRCLTSKSAIDLTVNKVEKSSVHPPYHGNKLRISRHARERISDLFPGSEREILRYCKRSFLKLNDFVGNCEFRYIAPKHDLKLIIRDKMLIGVSTKKYEIA